MDLYTKNALQCSKKTTRNYSTSFSLGIRVLKKRYRYPVHGVYGFVRIADEIVDTFHNHDKATMLKHFREETYKAIDIRNIYKSHSTQLSICCKQIQY
jgi:phytoene synthase